MNGSVVVMGVAGCGKSTVGVLLAQALGWPLLEGDDFHSMENRQKMRQGTPLTDADRAGWLETLAAQLSQARQRAQPVVLTCSALKRTYRDRLRAADPALRFAFLHIDIDQALARVQARASDHFFPPQLVVNQFATLENPEPEPGVLRLDAQANPAQTSAQAHQWVLCTGLMTA